MASMCAMRCHLADTNTFVALSRFPREFPCNEKCSRTLPRAPGALVALFEFDCCVVFCQRIRASTLQQLNMGTIQLKWYSDDAPFTPLLLQYARHLNVFPVKGYNISKSERPVYDLKPPASVA